MSNTQENNKFLTKERKIYLEVWIIIAIYLAIALPIHFYVPAFSWHWFTFGLIFLIIPLGIICFKTYFENKMNQTTEQQKRFNQALGIGMFKLWMADFVYMTAFNHWLIPTYILGIIFIITVFNALVKAFLGKRNINSFLNFCLAADLIIGIALTIYLIYIIPENTGNLQNIITTIIAAIYGGLLTLVGVAWTIKKTDNDRRDEERKKYRPYVTLSLFTEKDMVACETFDSSRFIENDSVKFIPIAGVENYEYFIPDFIIHNTNYAPFIVKGLLLNEILFEFNIHAYIEKMRYVHFTFDKKIIYTNQDISRLSLLIEDILGNEYLINLKQNLSKTQQLSRSFLPKDALPDKPIQLDHTINQIKVIDIIGLKERCT